MFSGVEKECIGNKWVNIPLDYIPKQSIKLIMKYNKNKEKSAIAFK